jgi:Mg2+ and Co2+ transporter CorA
MKNALTSHLQNYNLIAIKESFSVERLTRVTLILANITILFTPVTLMTGYYSIQFKNNEFEIVGYWKMFGIIFGISIFCLVLFSVMTGMFEHKIITKAWTRAFYDVGRRLWLQRRNKGVRFVE